MVSTMKSDIKQYMLKNKNLNLAVNPDCFVNEVEFLDKIAKVLSFGVKFLTIYQGGLSDFKFLQILKILRQLTCEFEAILVVVNRIDMALLAEVDGIYLNESSVDINSAFKIIEDKMLVGFEISNLSQLNDICANNVDYFCFKNFSENFSNNLILNPRAYFGAKTKDDVLKLRNLGCRNLFLPFEVVLKHPELTKYSYN